MTTDNGAREEMRSAYDPSEVEERTYRAWEEGGFFKPQGGERPFTVIMPPPNLTGELHMGHALTAAVEDALIRWHRHARRRHRLGARRRPRRDRRQRRSSSASSARKA